ncbi:MAG TPA: outer membrane beta-barrel family protein, partial [Chitinophagaceae bacterium]
FDNNSATGYYNVVQQDYQEDSSKSNRFILHEQNLAAYISSQKDFNKQWSVKAGLRYEYSIIDGHSPDSTTHNRFQYGKWFPTLYITYKPGRDHTFSFNYSKRINRPNFRQLSPFRWYTNPYSYYTGNPLLQPSYNHNIELAYLYKSIFSLTLYGQELVNGYGGIVEVNGDRKVVIYENYLNRFNTGVEATFGLKIFAWWEHRDVMSFNYSHSRSSVPEVVPVQGFGGYYSTYNTFTVTRAISLLLNFSHYLPSNSGNVHNKADYSLSTGARLGLGKVQVNITLSDILRTAQDRGVIYYQGYVQNFNEYYDVRRIVLALTYTFGKTKVKGSSKQVNFKETQRAN